MITDLDQFPIELFGEPPRMGHTRRRVFVGLFRYFDGWRIEVCCSLKDISKRADVDRHGVADCIADMEKLGLVSVIEGKPSTYRCLVPLPESKPLPPRDRRKFIPVTLVDRVRVLWAKWDKLTKKLSKTKAPTSTPIISPPSMTPEELEIVQNEAEILRLRREAVAPEKRKPLDQVDRVTVTRIATLADGSEAIRIDVPPDMLPDQWRALMRAYQAKGWQLKR